MGDNADCILMYQWSVHFKNSMVIKLYLLERFVFNWKTLNKVLRGIKQTNVYLSRDRYIAGMCMCVSVSIWALTSPTVSLSVAAVQCSGVSLRQCGGSLS